LQEGVKPHVEEERELQSLRHEDITDELILANPFMFALNRSKLVDIEKETQIYKNNECGAGEALRLPINFDLFNRRTEFPYDTIDNPMRLNPHYDQAWTD